MRIPFIYLVRTVAAFAVVMVHTSAIYVSPPNFGKMWWFAHTLDSMSRIGVPLYFMITGAVFLHRQEPLLLFYKKRAKRIIPALLFWSFVYYTIVTVWDKGGLFEWTDYFLRLLTNGHYFHLWNLYTFILIYLFTPILQHAAKHIPNSHIKWYALVSGGLITLSGTLKLFDLTLPLYSNPFVSAIAYLLLGYAIAHEQLQWRGIHWMGLASLAFIVFGTYIISAPTGFFNDLYYGRSGLPVMLIAVTVFMTCRTIAERAPQFADWRIFKTFSNASFGIYLVHPLIIYFVLERVPEHWFQFGSSVGALALFFTFVFVTSFLISAIMQRIPLLNKTI